MPVQSGNNPADLSGMSGKALARARRASLAKQGKNAIAKGGQRAERTRSQAASSMTRQQAAPKPAPSSQTTVSSQDSVAEQICQVADANPTGFGQEGNRVRNICRARRQALSAQGRGALPPKPTSQGGPGRQRTPFVAPNTATVIDHAEASGDTASRNEDVQVDTLCTIAEVAPGRLGKQAKNVRDICRARRQALADRGKRAVPPKPASQGGPGRNGYQIDGYLDTGLNGREAAKRHRDMMCHYGRGSAPSCRPTGRVKKGAEAETPKKVETGHTLSGKSISGTQVDRKDRVTGNEPGSCRAVTGTEYVGSEQFQSFCKTKPEANPAKVNITSTARGHKVSGTEVARTSKITGEEEGSCANITGTEYLSSESLKTTCGIKARPTTADKVSIGQTNRNHMMVTGSDEFRPARATGNEAGASRAITGSQYSDEGVARLTINGAPPKVPMSHTFAGQSVTGTEVGHSPRITGDESGACRNVSGTEYLSNEQYQYCGTKPERRPAKVGIDRSNHGERITGNLVDRTEKVTGNEPGSCSRVTGSQYGQSSLCGGGVDKVRSMHTLSGNAVTGQQLDHGPKMSGDEHGGCMPVTGNEYYGQEHFAPYCDSTPHAHAAKVAETSTCEGQRISGPAMDPTGTVTGNEYGSALQVSGTPYADAALTGCAMPPSGRFGQNMAQRFSERYVQPAVAAQPAVPAMQAPVPAPNDFSIVPPARAARGRITGNSMDDLGRVTGPSTMAMGLITGTPEFRHGGQDRAVPHMGSVMPMPASAPAKPVAAQPQPQAVEVQPQAVEAAPVQTELQCAPEQKVRERITGEGEDRCRITGDDWSRNERVTGTEGQWAQGRNPSLRGQPRGGSVRGAWGNREVTRPDVPMSKITGSSGNDAGGSVITYSGGARG